LFHNLIGRQQDVHRRAAAPPDLSSKENPARRLPLPGFQGLSRQQG
jgi:hypothetical protein